MTFGTRDAPLGYHRRVITISAEDSPNVVAARIEESQGRKPSGIVILPGVLTWQEYQARLRMWDKIRQCVGLRGEFYEGAELMMFPQAWLVRAGEMHKALLRIGLTSQKRRGGKTISMGVDTAEGGDLTSFSVGDEYGLLFNAGIKTPNTAVIKGMTLGIMKEWGVPATRVAFDRGGGGKQVADQLRDEGHEVMTVSFGEPVARRLEEGGAKVMPEERIEEKDVKYTYKTRRSQMFGALRDLLNPEGGDEQSLEESREFRRTWAIPEEYVELREELAPIPLTYDREGMIELLPKHRKDDKDKRRTLTEVIGHSPDRADATVLCIYAMQHEEEPVIAGGGW